MHKLIAILTTGVYVYWRTSIADLQNIAVSIGAVSYRIDFGDGVVFEVTL